MRVAIKTDNPLEWLGVASGAVPVPLVEAFMGMGLCRCLVTACRLGVFDALGDGELTADEVAGQLEADPRGTHTLLAALNGFGYLRRRDGRFRNGKLAHKWLRRDAKKSMLDTMLFVGDLWDRLEQLDGAVRTGEMPRFHDADMDPEFWGRYVRGLASFARIAAGETVRKVKLPAAPKRLLDVGGGHGMFSCGFCRRYPDLAAEVLDLPEVAEHGRALVADEDGGDRVTYRPADMRTDAWGDGYDLVLIFNVLHNSTEDEAIDAVRRAHAALVPGGTLAIMDSEHRPVRGNYSAVAGFNELFFFMLSGAQAWPEATMRGWMTVAGFGPVRSKRLMTLPDVLLMAERPA